MIQFIIQFIINAPVNHFFKISLCIMWMNVCIIRNVIPSVVISLCLRCLLKIENIKNLKYELISEFFLRKLINGKEEHSRMSLFSKNISYLNLRHINIPLLMSTYIKFESTHKMVLKCDDCYIYRRYQWLSR